MIKAMLDNVVVLLWPTINPDGQQMVAEWYMQNVGTPYELSGLPRLYQEYVGHDNNRDAYMLNMVESRVLEHTWRQWEPQIIYVHHQTGPFPTRIWLPPFSEPVGIDAPFLMSREVNMIGMAIAKGLEERGQVGATHMGTAFDAWYPGYVDYAPNFKNIAAFWTETALFQYATPHEYTIDDFPQNMRDLRPQSLYSSPWPPGMWRLRDAVDYMETASLVGDRVRGEIQGLAAVQSLPGGTRSDRARQEEGAVRLLHPAAAARSRGRRRAAPPDRVRRRARLRAHGAGDRRRARPFPPARGSCPPTRSSRRWRARSWTSRRYPDLRQYPGGPPERPYDAAGWSLPLQMGVRVVAATSSADRRCPRRR